MWYPNSENVELHVYTDANWVGCVDDRKSTSGGAVFLGDRLVTWTSKKQNCISQSMAKVKYVAPFLNCSTIVCIKQMIKDFGIQIDYPIVIHYDNTITINMSKNPMMHAKTKHIEIKYHFLREKVVEKEVMLDYVTAKDQLANIFTKPFPKDTFEYLREKLELIPFPNSTQKKEGKASVLWN